ncbi:hypothetical protein N7520_001701 [Penicillium odoratum]|uniref:uncharacterized protein n=1 Tax=Penicillium odoratum TaxID=1167516 RepID=UPI002548FBC2|nr:uncharacterized protein N7520_001701 [Penicillium odoratum]KAJ5778455.1 hypothetical protein N7520_001701 [Penicillium odoratum]
MISKQNVPTVLMAVILLLSLIRLLILYRFGSKWSAYKIDYAVGTTSCNLFAVLLGLFWTERSPFLRINSQPRPYKGAPRMLLILARLLVICSTVATLAVALVGAFVQESIHQGGLFILCVDYFAAAMWYWWLLQHENEGQTTFRRITYYLAGLTLILLVIAIVGILRVSWIIALETQLITVFIWASLDRLVV